MVWLQERTLGNKTNSPFGLLVYSCPRITLPTISNMFRWRGDTLTYFKKNLFCVAVAALLISAGASAQTASHQYRLNGSLTDDFGGASLVSNGGTLAGNRYSFGANQGLTLSEQLGAVYTIDLAFSFNGYSGFQKIIDFNDLLTEKGIFTENESYLFDFNTAVQQPLPPLNDEWMQLTMTRDSASLVSIYSNGSFITSFNDASAAYADLTGKPVHFFMADEIYPSDAGAGQVDYIRTYNTALSAEQVAGLSTPVAAIPEPETYAMLLAGLALIGAAVKRRKANQA
jgi:Concanavalin A-like lectin/glucanases superfamily/PEP-CTERM motif